MNIPFELQIALRYLLARRRQAFISVISFVSILGVTVGVMALVVALALMTGLQGELRDRILGSTAHIYVWKTRGGLADYRAEVEKLRTVPGVQAAAPAIIGKALVRTPGADAFITLKGIDPALEGSVTAIERSIVSGKLSDLGAGDEDAPPGIFLGQDLAQQLGAMVGDSVEVVTPEGTLSPMGMIPRIRRLRVAGTFKLGLYEFDSAWGLVSMEEAQRLLNKEGPELLEARTDDIDDAPAVAQRIVEQLGPDYLTQDWTMLNRSLFSALWLEKMAISITIGLIVMVAALNIVASLVLLVMEKSPDIAILKTMGASARSVMVVFMLQGLIIGLVGTFVGAVAGFGLSWLLDRYQLIQIPGDVYQITYVRFTLLPQDLVVVVVVAVLICFVATIYPSRQASKLKPVEALRYG
jgi:lipoprotein-releasing system permease protein